MRSARFTVAFAALCATGSCGTDETPSLLVLRSIGQFNLKTPPKKDRFFESFSAMLQRSHWDPAQVAMLARDEEHLLEKHLPHWREICDSFLLGLDSRNKDSVENVMSLLS